ncbi:hypothetical protein ACFP3I_14500 [Chryseobacterium arachidis]
MVISLKFPSIEPATASVLDGMALLTPICAACKNGIKTAKSKIFFSHC